MYSNEEYNRPRERRWAEGEQPEGSRKSWGLGLKPAPSRPGQPTSDVESERMHSVYQKSKSDIEMYSNEEYNRPRERRWADGERPVEPSRAQVGRLKEPTQPAELEQPGQPVGPRKSWGLGLKPAPSRPGQPTSDVVSDR